MKVFRCIGALALLGMAAGCAQSSEGTTPNLFADLQAVFGGNAAVSPEQAELRNQEEEYRTYAESRLQAAAAGALVGGLIGALVDDDNPGRGAVVGALAGGTVGYVGATYLTREHSDFVASQEALEQDIEVANELTRSSQRNVEVAQAALNYQHSEIARLNEEYNAGRLDTAAYERRLEIIAEDRASVRSMIAVTEKRVASMETSIAAYQRSGYDTARLELAVMSQRRDIANLRVIEEAMVDLISGVPEDVPRPSV